MKKACSLLFIPCLFLLATQSYASKLLKVDTVKACITESEINLDHYLFNAASNAIWQGDFVKNTGSINIFDVDESGIGEFKVYVTGIINGNNETDSLIMMVVDLPKVMAGKYDSVCVDDLEFLLDKNSPKGKTGAWYYQGIDRTRWDSISNEFNPSGYGVSEHFFAYVYNVPNTVCRDTGYTSISVNPLPEPQILTSWSPKHLVNRICITEEPKILKGNLNENGDRYLDWSWHGRGISELSGNQFAFIPQKAGLGEHTLTYTVTNIYGCVGIVSENVIVDGHAKLDFTYVRNGQTILFDGSDINKTNLTWHFGDGDTSVERSPIHTYAQSGIYTVKVTSYDLAEEKGNVCPDSSLTKEIEIYPLGIDNEKEDINLIYDHRSNCITVSNIQELESYSISDLNGKIVLAGNFSKDYRIQTGNLKSSIYIVSIISKSGVTYQSKMNLN